MDSLFSFEIIEKKIRNFTLKLFFIFVLISLAIQKFEKKSPKNFPTFLGGQKLIQIHFNPKPDLNPKSGFEIRNPVLIRI